MTQERDAAVEKLEKAETAAGHWFARCREVEGLLRDFIASTDNAGTSCGCCQREEHHPNCPVLRAKAFLTPTPPTEPKKELYPCDTCGTMRTKAEGGTTFTVCDECWDKEHPKTAEPLEPTNP